MAMDSPTPSLRDQGMAALRDKDLDRAVDLLARAVMANDRDADAKALLGIAYCQKGMHAQAKRALQTAIELQPSNANFRYNLGVVLEHADDKQGAAIAFNETLKLSPEHSQAKAKLAALGPQAHAWIAAAPRPSEPVGVPGHASQPPLGGTYGAPPTAPPLGGTYGAPPPQPAPPSPPLGGTYGAPPPAAPPLGGSYGAPAAVPPAAPPLGGTYGAPPPSAVPPAAPPPGGTYGAPPLPVAPPPGGTYGAPPAPPAPPVGGGYGAPPPPPGGAYGAPPAPPTGATIPGFGAPPPPPPGAGAPMMPPPPIGNPAAVPVPMGMAPAPMTPAGEAPAGTVQCPNCGAFPPAAMLCQFCGHPLPPPQRHVASAGPVDRPYVSPPVNFAPDMSNGEAFFRRLGAFMIDGFLLGIVGRVIGMVMGAGAGTLDSSDPSAIARMLGLAGAQLGIQVGIQLAYFVVMTALTGQTLGKMALGIMVVGENGEKPGFGAVLLRETVGKWLSGCVFYVGYLAVLWSDDQKAWHDGIAHTQVVRK